MISRLLTKVTLFLLCIPTITCSMADQQAEEQLDLVRAISLSEQQVEQDRAIATTIALSLQQANQENITEVMTLSRQQAEQAEQCNLAITLVLTRQEAEERDLAKAVARSLPSVPLAGLPNIPYTDWSGQVKQQYGAMCGYHAVYNIAYIMYAMLANYHPELIENVLRQGPPLELWQSLIQQRGGQLENINDDDINYLVFQVKKLPRALVTIIPNLHDWSPVLDANFCTIAERLQKMPGYIHGFLVNTAGHHISKDGKQEHKGFGGHWTALIAHNQNGTIHVHAADSARNPDTKGYGNVNTIQKLYTWLTTEHTILRALTEIPHKLETAQNVIAINTDYERGQELINEVRTLIAATPGLEHNRYYRDQVAPQLRMIQRQICKLA